MTAVCIAGMHRSGTSMLARILNLSGLYLGEPADILVVNPHNPEILWENIHFVSINEAILADLDGGWDLLPTMKPGWVKQPRIAARRPEAEKWIDDLARHGTWGWKDPRNTLTLPFWRELIPGLKVVACLRNPLEVARSLAVRGSSSFAFSLKLWQAYNARLQDILDDGVGLVTHYDTFFYDAQAELRRLLGFLEMAASEQQIEAACRTAQNQLKHNKTRFGEIGGLKDYPDMSALYSRLCEQAGPVYQRLTREWAAQAAAAERPAAAVIHGSLQESSVIAGEGESSPADSSSVRESPSAPLVSVVLLNYDGRDDLETCLRSLGELDFPADDLETIVVDNGSSDTSLAMLRSEFPRVRIIQNYTNAGFSVAANQGAAAAQGTYVAFLNNDTRVERNWLNALLQAIRQEPEIACAGSMVLNWDGTAVDYFGRTDDLFCLRVPGADPPPISLSSDPDVETMFVSGGALLIRKDVFREFGGFDTDYFMYHEDVDLGWRLWLGGRKSVLSPRSIVFHKGGASSKRLPIEFISRIQLRNMLFTAFQNMEAGNLEHVLPLLLFYLLERGRRWRPAAAPLPELLREFAASLEPLIEKRLRVQSARVVSDEELFSRLHHPFAFLLDEPLYETVRTEVLANSAPVDFDPADAASVRNCLAEWMNAAHFVHEGRLVKEISQNEQSLRALSAQVNQRNQAIQALTAQVHALTAEIQALSARLAEQEQAGRAVQAQLQEVYGSRSWRLMRIAQRIRLFLIPLGSLREKAVRRVLAAPRRLGALPVRLRRKLTVALRPRRLRPMPRRVRAKYAAPSPDRPDVSIILPVHNRIELTLHCLLSLADSRPQANYEVILIDDASNDDTARILKDLKGIKYIHNARNLGFLASCNRAAQEAHGSHLAFLNNDTRVHPGWLDSLLAVFSVVPDAGLVGSKLILPDGTLQEAGGIIWADGSAMHYGRGGDPRHYLYNYVRPADYVSGASLMLPRKLWEQLHGFDENYGPAYYEDVDLAFRVRQAGYEVVYQPFSELTHVEGGTNGNDLHRGPKRYQLINQQKFFSVWQSTIASHALSRQAADPIRRRRAQKGKVLFIDDSTPEPDHYAGGVLSEFYITTLSEAGYAVTFLPHLHLGHAGAYTQALQKRGVECVYEPFVTSSEQYIQENGRSFDYVVISRASVAHELIDTTRIFAPQARIIFNTIDLHFLRLERAAQVSQSDQDLQTALEMRESELSIIRKSACTLVTSDAEQQLLATLVPSARVRAVPFPADVHEVKCGFSERKEIVFLGGFGHQPNDDAVLFFARDIWPLLAARLPDARLIIAGAYMTPEVRRLESGKIIVRGYVENLGNLFQTAKMSIAPLRFGAGLKGKVLTSLGYGVPCVATSIGAEGTGLTDKMNILIADTPDEIGQAVADLYTSPSLWASLSQQGQAWISKNFSRAVVAAKLLDVFQEL